MANNKSCIYILMALYVIDENCPKRLIWILGYLVLTAFHIYSSPFGNLLSSTPLTSGWMSVCKCRTHLILIIKSTFLHIDTSAYNWIWLCYTYFKPIVNCSISGWAPYTDCAINHWDSIQHCVHDASDYHYSSMLSSLQSNDSWDCQCSITFLLPSFIKG